MKDASCNGLAWWFVFLIAVNLVGFLYATYNCIVTRNLHNEAKNHLMKCRDLERKLLEEFMSKR